MRHGLDGHLRPAPALLQRVPLRPVQHPGPVQRRRGLPGRELRRRRTGGTAARPPSLVDNATAEHSAPCLQGCGAILTPVRRAGRQRVVPRRLARPGAGGRRRSRPLRGLPRRVDLLDPHARAHGRSHGAARSAWRRSGGPRGPLGYPTTERRSRPTGSGGARIPARGRVRQPPDHHQRGVRRGLRKWAALAGIRGRLGYPGADGRRGRDGRGRGQVFVGGQVWALSGKPAYAVTGRVLAALAADGAETGRWGYPTGDVRVLADGRQRGPSRRGTTTVTAVLDRRGGGARSADAVGGVDPHGDRPRAPCGRCGPPASRPGRR